MVISKHARINGESIRCRTKKDLVYHCYKRMKQNISYDQRKYLECLINDIMAKTVGISKKRIKDYVE